MKYDSKYSLRDLVNAVKELDYAEAVHEAKHNELKAKQAAIRSFEEEEHKAFAVVERLQEKVKFIASNMEKK